MGLPKAALRFLIREHVRKPLAGSVATLGRMCVYATYPQLIEICHQEGIAPAQPTPESCVTSNIPAWRDTPLEQNASDVAFFRMLGVKQTRAIDYSDFEGAEIVADLNQPIRDELHEQFDIVVDSGTIEHIFDTRAVLMNIGRMLRPGGRVIHMTPCNNFANHGFFQISPTLLIDYYQANAFRDVNAWVAAQTTADPATSDWELFQLDPRRQPVMMTSRQKLLTLVVAEKHEDSTFEAIPLQSYYREQFGPSEVGEKGTPIATTWSARLKHKLPVGFKHFVRTHFLRSAHEKPWGCKRVGRLK